MVRGFQKIILSISLDESGLSTEKPIGLQCWQPPGKFFFHISVDL
jgi:hypothetical protein